MLNKNINKCSGKTNMPVSQKESISSKVSCNSALYNYKKLNNQQKETLC